jgi:5-hydroxyisourate hydrolase
LFAVARAERGRPGSERVSGITTHVLDLALGRPAKGVPVRLEFRSTDRGWVKLAERATDGDGRVRDLLDAGIDPAVGRYRITFGTGEYFRGRGEACFHPEVAVVFEIAEPAQHYHVPLLLSPFGYSTYRGS